VKLSQRRCHRGCVSSLHGEHPPRFTDLAHGDREDAPADSG
jgi:hypothetical protein